MDSNYANAAREILNDRIEEINSHLSFIYTVQSEGASLLARFDKKEAFKIIHYELSRDFIRTQTATTFLLLYNAVESVMTELLDAIHVTLVESSVSYADLKPCLQSRLIKSFKSRILEPDNNVFLSGEMNTIFEEVVARSYIKEKFFSGNITKKVIENCSQDFGFSIAEHDKSISKNGKYLSLIKDKRNELAHGSLSFKECGKEVTVEELQGYTRSIEEYLSAVITGVGDYLDNALYLENAS